ncbi:host attachment protein [Massilia glaciei]|uniref:Host attachment protein n=1 Tax=Massilia glaciei TaxID=1524097 RepID=A0A2U2HKF3_9BURK|nr:host attachment protein [Massilia glaciei]PWF47932.1 host attachment protein [Massilia glaciei]
MDTVWIVSANAGRARFFSQARHAAPFEEINDMVNSAERLRPSETERDQIGQLAASKSGHNTGAPVQPSGYDPAKMPDQIAAELFAKDVAAFLLRAWQEGRFDQLRLTASPQFLGLLRKMLDPRVAALMREELSKDYTQLNAKQLREQLGDAPPLS